MIESPYITSLKLRNKLMNTRTKINPLLGLPKLEYTRNLGSSASGMILAISEIGDDGIFIKLFPTICNWKKIKRNDIIIKKIKDIKLDKDLLELGFTKLLSDLLFNIIPFTQNITAFYFSNSCLNGYKTNISKCSLEPINDLNYIVAEGDVKYPHNSLMVRYNNGELSDRINFMGVERCFGDLERYLISSFKDVRFNEIVEEEFERIMNSIFIQIIITLECLNDIFKPFRHSDIGPRNILYSSYNIEEYNNTYFKYSINDRIYEIENVSVIPKLWDFSNIYLSEEQKIWLKDNECFSYLREDDEFKTCTEEIIPNMSQLCKGIAILPEFEFVRHTKFAEKILHIINVHDDNFEEFIELFNTYKSDNKSTLLQAEFIYKS